MRKLMILAATTIALSACQPAAKEDAAAPEATETVTAEPEAAPAADAMAPADAAKAAEAAAPADEAAAATDTKGTEHTGGIKVGQ